jgi:hypothetical protein
MIDGIQGAAYRGECTTTCNGHALHMDPGKPRNQTLGLITAAYSGMPYLLPFIQRAIAWPSSSDP